MQVGLTLGEITPFHPYEYRRRVHLLPLHGAPMKSAESAYNPEALGASSVT